MAGSVDAVPLGVSLYSAMSRNPGLLMTPCRVILSISNRPMVLEGDEAEAA